MKKSITLFSIFLLSLGVAFGQNYNWAHGYTGPGITLSSPDNAGGVYIAVNFNDSINLDPQLPSVYTTSTNGGGAAVSRIDANGNLSFSFVVEVANASYYNLRDIQTLSDGSFYLIASIRNAPFPLDIDPSSSGTFNIENNCMAISHFDAAGNFLDAKIFNIETYKFEFFQSTISSTDELLISGAVSYGAHFSDVDGQDTTYAPDQRRVFAAKYDSNLDLIWVDYFTNVRSTQYSVFNYAVGTLKPNGKTVVAYAFGGPITLTNTNSYTPSGDYDIVLIEYDVNGTILNDFVLSTSGVDDNPLAITSDMNNNIYLSCFLRNQADIDLANTNPDNTLVQNTFFAIYDDAFNLKHFKSASMGNTRVKEMKVASNGDLLVAGRLFNSFDFDFVPFGDQFYNLQSIGGSGYDVFLAKFDTSLSVIYAHNIGNSSNYGDVYQLRLNNTDDIFITGQFGGGIADMNFGTLTNNIDGFSITYGFVAKYQLCNTNNIVINASVCPGGTYTFVDGSIQSNIFSPVSRISRYTGISSCDSVITTYVAISPTYSTTDSVTVCAGSSYTFADGFVQNNITSTFSHVNNLQTVSSCDSIVTTSVGVITIDTGITQNVNVLTVNETGASYVWIDCGTLLPVPSATLQSFEPTVSGNYQVEVTKNGCTETSECFSFIHTGISVHQLGSNIKIYPNPSDKMVSIAFSSSLVVDNISLLDMQGRVLNTILLPTKSTVEMDLSSFADGIYFIKIVSNQGISIDKIVKK